MSSWEYMRVYLQTFLHLLPKATVASEPTTVLQTFTQKPRQSAKHHNNLTTWYNSHLINLLTYSCWDLSLNQCHYQPTLLLVKVCNLGMSNMGWIHTGTANLAPGVCSNLHQKINYKDLFLLLKASQISLSDKYVKTI